MRRERIITRTIISTKATVLLYNITTKESHEESFTLSGSIKKEVSIENKVKQELEESGRLSEKVVSVLSFVDIDALYAITESNFIAHATKYESREALAEALKGKDKEAID
jgi:hypothetical protein